MSPYNYVMGNPVGLVKICGEGGWISFNNAILKVLEFSKISELRFIYPSFQYQQCQKPPLLPKMKKR
jgi:hypothetical protein